jgi:hypothetical protein
MRKVNLINGNITERWVKVRFNENVAYVKDKGKKERKSSMNGDKNNKRKKGEENEIRKE